MSGLAGIAGRGLSREQKERAVSRMMDFLFHRDFYRRDEIFSDDSICASRVHNDLIQRESQPCISGGLYIWFDGEFYNQEDLCRKYGVNPGTDPQLLGALFERCGDFSFLSEVNGIFAAVVYEPKQERVRLMIDRYGLRYLYWMVREGALVWGSEVKTMLALDGFTPRINREAIPDFFKIGFLTGDKTWFEEVNLLSPATVLTFHLGNGSLEREVYWGWDQYKPLEGPFDENEVVEELVNRFVRSVDRQCKEGEKIGVNLSGGLDSRAILAAIPERCRPVHTFTFGRPRSMDARFAAKAAARKGAVHHLAELNSRNWLMGREEGVWWTDGELSVLDMHALTGLESQRSFISVNLSGFLGDAVIGGSYEGRDFDVLEKGRRYINKGIKLMNIFIHSRMPFYDNDFLALAMALPSEAKAQGRIYKKMLLHAFPEFFKDIPWQNTGVPITSSEARVRFSKFKTRVANKLALKFSLATGLEFASSKDFANYPDWITREPARSFFEKKLFQRPMLYSEFFDPAKVRERWEEHLRLRNHTDFLSRLVTFEVWLEQVLEGRDGQTETGASG